MGRRRGDHARRIDPQSGGSAIREKKNYKFMIDGIGGVTEAKDYFEYKKAGADAPALVQGKISRGSGSCQVSFEPYFTEQP